MYDNNYIKSVLKKYIDKGVDKFIIYPYGENGVNTKNILKEFFGLEPCLIVDNEYSKYNSKIINKEMLKKVYLQEMCLILTIENRDLNAKLLGELLEIIPAENIINLYQEKKLVRDTNYSGQGFMLRDFLPKAIVTSKKKNEKIKVRINCVFPNIWNMVSRIYRAFQEDSIFDVLLIVDGTWGCQRQAEEHQYKYVMCDDYRGGVTIPIY